MKFYKMIVFSILFLMLIATAATAEVADKIIAVVNDEVITQKEFNEVFAPYLKRIEDTYEGKDKAIVIKQTRDTVLQRLIDNLLIEYEAKKKGANIKDEEVMNVLKDMLARQNTGMGDYLKKLRKEGTSLESVKSEIRNQLMRMRLMRMEVKSKIMVSDQEIGEYYNRHRDDYEGKEAVRIKQILILIPPNAGKAAIAKLKEDAGKIQKRALIGEPFDFLAAKYSQGPMAAQGGDVGFIERGGMIPEIEAAAFSLPQGQVSSVIQSSEGFHIIKVIDKRGAGHKTIAAVREEIKTKLEDEKLEKKYDEWITSVRKRSHIDVRM